MQKHRATPRAAPPLKLISGGSSPPRPDDNLEAAFRGFSRYVASIALRLLGRDDEVDDVVQEVFLAALNDLGKLRQPEALRGWLATVTVRIASRKLRMRRLRSFLGLGECEDYSAIAAAGGQEQEQAVLIARIYTALDELPVDQRVAWTLRNIEGERLDAVAKLCGCSLATAKRRIAAAQTRIEEAVRDA